MAQVDFGGITKQICVAYLPDIAVMSTMVHVGFAIQRMDEGCLGHSCRPKMARWATNSIPRLSLRAGPHHLGRTDQSRRLAPACPAPHCSGGAIGWWLLARHEVRLLQKTGQRRPDES